LTFFFDAKLPATQLGFFKLAFDLTDSNLPTPYNFKIEVFNEAPYFLEPLVDQYVKLGNEVIYQLPEAEDAEFLPIKISVRLDTN
jgi:hypothetical protein